MSEFVPGVFYGMAASEYHAIEAMSSSGAKKMVRSPQHYKLMRDTPSEPTAAMALGTVVHAGVLEPDTLGDVVAVAPEADKRTKDGKAEHAAFAAAHAGKIILSAPDHARALACIEAVNAHRSASKLIGGGKKEVSLLWQDGRYKVPCKCRYDTLNHGGVVDLKTTQDASPDGFARQAANLLYHVQAAAYLSGGEHALHATPQFFAFVCVETEPPHAVACYVLPSNAIRAGAVLWDIALERYAAALAAGTWPGYAETITTLPFPKWATRFDI